MSWLIGRVLFAGGLTTNRLATIHLGLLLPAASCDLPARSGGPPSNAYAAPPKRRLLDLAPGGVYLATPVTRRTGGLLHHRFTLTAPTGVDVAVCFLWHFPAGCPGWELPTTLPCGARTFLGRRSEERRVGKEGRKRGETGGRGD